MREKIGKIATDAAKAVNYNSAGTIEGLFQDGEYYFLEMNTRVQVEHCVTEMTTGIDIVKEQIKVAAGAELSLTQDEVTLTGHAIECRINAEDASKKFAPAPGKIGDYREPSGPGVRVDSGVKEGSEVTPIYDPMVAKLIVWDRDREQATKRMLRALEEFEITELKTLIPFHKAILETDQWANAETCRDLVEDKKWLKTLAFPPAVPADDDAPETAESTYKVEVSGRLFDVKVIGAPAAGGNGGAAVAAKPKARAARKGGGAGGGGDTLASPLQGTILKVSVEKGATVAEGDLICVIEAMMMEIEINAHKDGNVEVLAIEVGATVSNGDKIAVL